MAAMFTGYLFTGSYVYGAGSGSSTFGGGSAPPPRGGNPWSKFLRPVPGKAGEKLNKKGYGRRDPRRPSKEEGKVGRDLTTQEIVGRTKTEWQQQLHRSIQNKQTQHIHLQAAYYEKSVATTQEQLELAQQKIRVNKDNHEYWTRQEKRARFILKKWHVKTRVYYVQGQAGKKYKYVKSHEEMLAYLKKNLKLIGTTVYFRHTP